MKEKCLTVEEKTKYLTERGVAEVTGFALSTLRNWRATKKGITYSKLGRAVRYEMNDVIAFMQSHRVEIGP